MMSTTDLALFVRSKNIEVLKHLPHEVGEEYVVKFAKSAGSNHLEPSRCQVLQIVRILVLQNTDGLLRRDLCYSGTKWTFWQRKLGNFQGCAKP